MLNDGCKTRGINFASLLLSCGTIICYQSQLMRNSYMQGVVINLFFYVEITIISCSLEIILLGLEAVVRCLILPTLC